MGVFAFCQSFMYTVFPPEFRSALLKIFNRIFNCCSSYCYFDITEIDGVNTNELYNAVQLYLSSSASITGSRLSLTRALNSSAITFGLSNNDRLVDNFKGVDVVWEHVVMQRQSQSFSWRPMPEEKRGFVLKIKKNDKSLILNLYLDFIMERATDISEVLIKNRRDRQKAISELLDTLKRRAEKRSSRNGVSIEKDSMEVEDEEQEKRALESPEEECGLEEGCEKEEKKTETKGTVAPFPPALPLTSSDGLEIV
ncbi:AAA-type ATPase, N-terminal domain [Dillenia turbinata]|uniref:AAA-type ATPase, N-terminal domain n=1 Tax=Dillenia turbinata TaxID=194707 RepID=A0AAN8WAS6_9MAGN